MIKDRFLFIGILLILLCLNSCDTSSDLTEHDEAGITIRLVVSIRDNASFRTKTIDMGETSAIGNEYYIQPQDVQVLVYNLDGQFRCRATMTTVETTNNFSRYIITGALSGLTDPDSEKEYKVVILANLRGMCPVAFSADHQVQTEQELYDALTFPFYIQDTLFSNRVLTGSHDMGRIPMWGMKTTQLKDQMEISMDMLRALSKVEVCIDANIGRSLQKVVLHHGQSKGYITPKQAATQKDTYRVDDNNAPEEINIPSSSNMLNIDIPFVEEGGHYYLYLPEQPTLMPTDIEKGVYMMVTVDDEKYPLYFATYDEPVGTFTQKHPFPVLRNHWYTFNITNVFPDKTELRYEICDWNKRNGDIEFN